MGKITALPAGIPTEKLLAAPFPPLASLVVACSKLVLPQDGVAVALVKQVLGPILLRSQPVVYTLLLHCCSG